MNDACAVFVGLGLVAFLIWAGLPGWLAFVLGGLVTGYARMGDSNQG